MKRRDGQFQAIASTVLLAGAITAYAQSPASQPSSLPTIVQPTHVHPIREVLFEGNKVISTQELQAIARPYIGREMAIERLETIRRLVTQHYIDKGYINSGAVLPPQDVSDGQVKFQIVEGKLTDVHIVGVDKNGKPAKLWLRPSYLSRRIEYGAGDVLNIVSLKETMERLRQNPNVERLVAELKPGAEPGTSRMEIQYQETNPWWIGAEFSNRRSPDVGPLRLEALAGTTNLTGNSDEFFARYTVARGFFDDIQFADADELSLSYELPISPSDTSIFASYARSDVPVIESDFADLAISSETNVLSLGIRKPIYRTSDTQFALTLSGEYQDSQTRLFGEPFSFSPGAENGKSVSTTLKFGQEFFTRNSVRSISLRSSFNLGVDALNATEHVNEPDGQFFLWVGQAQYIRRLGDSNCLLVLRGAMQLAGDSLLSLQQYSIGGMDTVRGYRENQLVRDNGANGSIEFIIPLIERNEASILDLVPFGDIGYAWDHSAADTPPVLTSLGVGLHFHPTRRLDCRIYYAFGFEDFGRTSDLQDNGIHFDLLVRWP